MRPRLTVDAYLAGEETNRPRELAYGFVREPPAPTFHHQVISGRLHHRLAAHVDEEQLGVVVASPVDVILDRDRHLVVQPDLVFVRTDRLAICTDRIWGPPDLVIEVLSTGRLRHDRITKVHWYRKYGVVECWLVDTLASTIEVIGLTEPSCPRRLFEGQSTVESQVLPRLRLSPADVFRPAI